MVQAMRTTEKRIIDMLRAAGYDDAMPISTPYGLSMDSLEVADFIIEVETEFNVSLDGVVGFGSTVAQIAGAVNDKIRNPR
jgi:acyl carrier protein